jgi:F-type H+-transporting ATPase subunit delta
MSQAITIARPYAQAAFEFANEQNAVAAWQQALDSLAQVMANAEIKAIYNSVEISRKDFMAVIADLLKLEQDTPIYNFVRLLMTNKRLNVVSEISARFQALQLQAQEVLDVKVTTVVEMSEDERARLGERLQKKLGSKVILHCRTQKDILGGMVLQYGDKVIDSSLKTQVEKLAHDLIV